ncbi:MAG: hypothetical protein J5832_06045 [Clostridia bacterium]|nr:hypothetical protein [Clostridia bacterium]
MLGIKLLGKEIKYRLIYAILAGIAFLVGFLINKRALNNTIEFLYVALAMFIGTIIFGENETELLASGRLQIEQIYVIRFFASYLCITVLPVLTIVFLRTAKNQLKAVVAFLALVLLFAAVGAFFRALLGKTLPSIIVSLLVFSILLIALPEGYYSPFNSLALADNRIFWANRAGVLVLSAIFVAATFFVFRYKNIVYRKKRR